MQAKRKKQIIAEIEHMNSVHGKGIVSAVIFGERYAGIDQSLSGMVVRQMQYGMDSVKFSLTEQTEDNSIGLTFLNHKRTISVGTK